MVKNLISLVLVLFMSKPSSEYSWCVRNTERWRPLVREILNERENPFDDNLILALIAQESCGNPYVVSQYDDQGSIGLMQVTPRPWTGSASWLRVPRNNINVGLNILETAYELAEGNMHIALQYYNAGKPSQYSYFYHGRRIVEEWLPIFEAIDPYRFCEDKIHFLICP